MVVARCPTHYRGSPPGARRHPHRDPARPGAVLPATADGGPGGDTLASLIVQLRRRLSPAKFWFNVASRRPPPRWPVSCSRRCRSAGVSARRTWGMLLAAVGTHTLVTLAAVVGGDHPAAGLAGRPGGARAPRPRCCSPPRMNVVRRSAHPDRAAHHLVVAGAAGRAGLAARPGLPLLRPVPPAAPHAGRHVRPDPGDDRERAGRHARRRPARPGPRPDAGRVRDALAPRPGPAPGGAAHRPGRRLRACSTSPPPRPPSGSARSASGRTVALGSRLVGDDDPELRGADRCAAPAIKDVIVVPLRSGQAVIGTLEVVNRLSDAGHFTPADVPVLRDRRRARGRGAGEFPAGRPAAPRRVPRRAHQAAQPAADHRRAGRGGQGPRARRGGRRCCSSTSTACARSTSRSGTPPATRCSPRWPTRLRACAPSSRAGRAGLGGDEFLVTLRLEQRRGGAGAGRPSCASRSATRWSSARSPWTSTPRSGWPSTPITAATPATLLQRVDLAATRRQVDARAASSCSARRWSPGRCAGWASPPTCAGRWTTASWRSTSSPR